MFAFALNRATADFRSEDFILWASKKMISVLIISKNEEDVIGECIKSVKALTDEIIVADDSDDGTSELAEKLGAKVVRNKFKNFADQRNLAASIARNPWIFYIDSDERVTPEFIKELKDKIKSVDPQIAGFRVRRKTFYYGRDWNFVDRMPRIFRKSKLKEWQGVLHETPIVEGKLLEINEPILHYTHRDLEQMVAKTNEWSEFEADLRARANHPKMNVLRFARVMITGFLRSYIKEKGYKNGTAGVVEAMYQAFSMFITYAKLWEKQHLKSLKEK